MKRINLKRFAAISALALTLMAAGCADSASNSTVPQPSGDSSGFKQTSLKTTDSATQVPPSKITESTVRVQECGIVAISSPPKYVCNGKVYTATELAKIRNDEAKKYQSGQ